jgi:hypothetical protein
VKRPKSFATEVDLCARFLSAVGPNWTAYAETAGWDILLSRKADGFQIGIEAKLKLNAEVVSQAIEDWGSWSADHAGPDCRAVLVPHGESGHFHRICAYIGVVIISVFPDHSANGGRYGYVFSPTLPGDRGSYDTEKWHEWAPSKRHQLPEYVPDVAAGSSSPIQLTKWKVAAIKIAIMLEHRGFVTRSDFKALHIDHRRWVAAESDWLRVVDGRFVRGPRIPDFRGQHPIVYEQIAADAGKWMLAAPNLASQGALL